MKKIPDIERALGLKPDELAKLAGCSLSTYYRYRNLQSKPSIDFFERVVEAVPELNPEWLFRDKVPVFKKYKTAASRQQEIQLFYGNGKVDTVLSFPFYKLNNGGVLEAEGTINAEAWGKSEDYFLLNTGLFDKQLSLAPENLVAVEVDCHIMAPELIQGTLCLADVSETSFSSQGFYLVKIHHLVKLRRLQLLTNGNLRVSTNSPLFRDLETHPEENGFQILAKIVWMGRSL